MMKETHLKEVQEVLLRVHPPLTRQRLHCLLHQQASLQSSLHQESLTNDKPSFISRKTKKILLVTKALSVFSSVL
jgi:hypothetical protein